MAPKVMLFAVTPTSEAKLAPLAGGAGWGWPGSGGAGTAPGGGTGRPAAGLAPFGAALPGAAGAGAALFAAGADWLCDPPETDEPGFCCDDGACGARAEPPLEPYPPPLVPVLESEAEPPPQAATASAKPAVSTENRAYRDHILLSTRLISQLPHMCLSIRVMT